MPACAARYDVQFNDGSGRAVSGGPGCEAVVDFVEERLPDDWGDPGPLVSAQLRAWRGERIRSIEYAPARGRMALWVDGSPRRARAVRRYLRWQLPDIDPDPHFDPEWVTPP